MVLEGTLRLELGEQVMEQSSVASMDIVTEIKRPEETKKGRSQTRVQTVFWMLKTTSLNKRQQTHGELDLLLLKSK